MEKIVDKRIWLRGKKDLVQQDEIMKEIINRHQGSMSFEINDPFETLCRSIVSQQISTKAASAIWQKLLKQVDEFDPKNIVYCAEEKMREAGLSRQKIAYIKNIAEFFEQNQYTNKDWEDKSYDQVSEELTSIKGVGSWTFEMFAMFHLKFSNILPIKDLGIIRSIEKNYNHREKLEKSTILEIAEKWHPWKTIASWYLWKDIDATPNKNIPELW